MNTTESKKVKNNFGQFELMNWQILVFAGCTWHKVYFSSNANRMYSTDFLMSEILHFRYVNSLTVNQEISVNSLKQIGTEGNFLSSFYFRIYKMVPLTNIHQKHN